MRCRRRSWRAPSSICGCSSIIASGWSASASRSTTRCSGICTTSGPNCGCRAARCSTATGARASPGGSRAPSRRCASASPATSCAASASSPRRSRRSRPRSPSLVAQIAPQLLSEPGFGPLTAAKLVGEIAGAEPVRQRRQARPRRRRRSDPRQLRQDQPPPPRPRRQPPDQRDHPPHRRHPPALPPRDPGLHRPQTRRRQEHQRSHPLPQTPPHPPHLAPPPDRRTRPRTRRSHHQSLDIGAAKAALSAVRAGTAAAIRARTLAVGRAPPGATADTAAQRATYSTSRPAVCSSSSSVSSRTSAEA